MKKKAKREGSQKPLELEKPSCLKIDRTVPYDLAQHYDGHTYTIWRGPKDGNGLDGEEEQDSKSLLIAELDPALLVKLTGLEEGEKEIDTVARCERVLPRGIHLDAKIVEALMKEEGWVTLEWIHRALEIDWIEFLGTTLRRDDGYRYSLCAIRDNGEPRNYGGKEVDARAHLRAGTWTSGVSWLGNSRDKGMPAVCLPLVG